VLLLQVAHPFVVSFHGAMQDDAHVYYLLGYCPGGDLAYHLYKHGSLKISAVRFFAAEIMMTVQVRACNCSTSNSKW
jgi:protein-serine/threonine kinase